MLARASASWLPTSSSMRVARQWVPSTKSLRPAGVRSRTLRAWVASPKFAARRLPHTEPERARLAACSHDGAVRVWDTRATALPLHTLAPHDGAKALCVLWANGFIVSGGDDSKLHAYHAEGAPASARLG